MTRKTSGRGRKLIQAKGEDEQTSAAKEFLSRQRELRDAQSTAQKLYFLQNKPGTPGSAKKTLAVWIELAEKVNPKLPMPPPPPEVILEYTAIDKHVLATPISETKSLPQLAQYLTKTSRDDKQKARAIFTWIVNNIRYDLDGVVKGKEVTRPDQVLATRATSCSGYANLYESLANFPGCKRPPSVAGRESISITP